MAIQKFEDDLNIISKLGDNPGTDNGLTTPQFRAKFDEAGLAIQKFINEYIIPAIRVLNNPEDGLAMKGNISMGGNKILDLAAPTDASHATNKQYVDEKLKTYEVILSAAGWSNNLQIVNVPGMTADKTKSDVLASAAPSDENYAAYSENVVRLYAQMDGAVQFKCEEVPDIDLTVNIMVRV